MKKKNLIITIVSFLIIFLLFWLNQNYWKIWLSPVVWEPTFWDRMRFFFVLIPAAIWDSINPCEFAIMFILLQSVLREQKSKKKVFFVWFSFILAIFLSYLAIWLWLYTALATTTNANILKLIAWVLGILVWLANLKDYFWYGKWFKMEVPDSWRPKMRKFIKNITSPIWAFFIWILISLFLLPCTSWPYITILWYLSSESSTITNWWYIYLVVYNIIFIIPMILIMFLVLTWTKDLSELKEYKELNVEKMHLVTWIIMIILWVYIFWDLYRTGFFG